MRFISIFALLAMLTFQANAWAAEQYYQDQEVYQEQSLDLKGLYALSTYHNDVIYHTNNGYYQEQRIPSQAYVEPLPSNTGYINAASYPVQTNYNQGTYNAYADQNAYNAYINQNTYNAYANRDTFGSQIQNDRFLIDAVSLGSALVPIVQGNINACTITNLLRRL